jgi:hypothetical protein
MGVAWVAGSIAVAVFGILSGTLAQALAEWIALAQDKIG